MVWDFSKGSDVKQREHKSLSLFFLLSLYSFLILMARHALCVGRVTGTNDPIANLAVPHMVWIWDVGLFGPCLFACPLGRRMCVAFITESHFNHRIFDLLPFDISSQDDGKGKAGNGERGSRPVEHAACRYICLCVCMWHIAIENRGGNMFVLYAENQ